MTVTQLQAEKILMGNQSFSQLGFSMMITRLRTRYKKEPSQTVLQTCVSEINMFLDKFKSIMLSDYEIIKNL